MGTKLNPGRFDCYANALPDEPMFVLLARDPAAPSAIVRWALWRRQAVFADVAPSSDLEMIDEALRCGIKMIGWRQDNLGQWHQRQTVAPSVDAAPDRTVDERLEQFREAVAALPSVAERLAEGQQFNAFERAGNDEEDPDEDLEFSICIGPVGDMQFIHDVAGRQRARLVEAAFKLATALYRQQQPGAALAGEGMAA